MAIINEIRDNFNKITHCPNAFDKDELVDKSACAVQRADLKMCLLMSDCVRKLKKTPRQCLKEPEGMVPDECFALKNAFFECKRSLIDMRARFRGIKN